MASYQSMPPAMAQGPGPITLPAGLTREYIHATFQKYRKMKEEGRPDNDPEMIKARNLLSAVQHNQRLKAQMEAKRAQQQHQQEQSPNGAVGATNGGAPPGAATASGNGVVPAGQPAPSTSHATQHPVGSSGATPGAVVFDAEQMKLLRNQIQAFRLLSKNASIPMQLQKELFPTRRVSKSASPAEQIAAANRALDNSMPTAAEAEPSGGEVQNAESSNERRRHLKSFVNPWSMFPEYINYMTHCQREERPFIPAIMPAGVNIEQAREDREVVIYNRLCRRLRELEELHANVGSWDARKSMTPRDDGELKTKTLIEYKALRLLPKQRALRQQLGKEMIQSDNLAMTVNRAMFRRVKRQSLREARITEKLEKAQRDARETKEKKKHIEFLESIVNHAHEIQKQGQQQRARTQKLGRLMIQTHQNIEKEEQKRIERTAKQRLQALKANDEETYLKLLGQAKDTRISHLLKQTDGFLSQLAASVKEQQRGVAKRYGDADVQDEDSDEDEYDDEEGGSKRVDYYEVAHRIKEDVREQSSNLVGGTLKEYQLKGLQWMISLYNNNLNGILADEMGLGKTIQTISLITYLIEKKNQPGPYLVIVPLSTLTNWNNEFEKWAPSVSRIIYKGPPNARKQQQQQIRWGNFQVLLTTYEFIIKDRPILSKVKWLHMVVDEGHRMKNAQSKLSSTITQYYTTRYRLILTGTPLQNNLPELWALLNFVLPNIFKSVKSFDEWFNTPFANTGGQDKMELSEEEQLLVIKRLHKVLRPFLLRRLKKDVEKDLPDKQERVIKCNFSALQGKLYKQLLTHNKLMVSDGKGGKTGIRGLSNMLMQLRKLCNHPFVFEEVEDQVNPARASNDLLWRTSGKFELLDRILPKFRATGHRVLMFFQMTQIMNIMEDFLRYRGLQYLRLDGSTKADDRSELLKQFNAENSPYFCFLLSTRAGGLGLNLQAADTVIIFDSDWNPHQDLQAQDRAHRIGQKNEVRILRLISSNSVEEKILERAQFKLDMDGKVIQAGKFDNKSTNEEREALLRVMLETAAAAENLEQEEQDDDDLNMIMMRSDDELITFQNIDSDRDRNSKYGPGKKFPRLLSEAELPEIYMTDDNTAVEEAALEESYGRGARERTRVRYDDGLTEEQWALAVDNDEDSIEAAIARKDARKERRAGRRDGRQKSDYGVEDSPVPSRESSEEPQPKKRGRKPKGDKRKAEEAQLEEPAVPKKRGRQSKAVDTLSAQDRTTLQTILDNVYETLNDLVEPASAPGELDRDIIGPFEELVSKADYPTYYQMIKNPIAMKQIQRKINRKEYQSLRPFFADIKLLCNNARIFNDDGSILWNDANLIEETALKKLREETEGKPEWKDFEEEAEGTGTAPISVVGTPKAG